MCWNSLDDTWGCGSQKSEGGPRRGLVGWFGVGGLLWAPEGIE